MPALSSLKCWRLSGVSEKPEGGSWIWYSKILQFVRACFPHFISTESVLCAVKERAYKGSQHSTLILVIVMIMMFGPIRANWNLCIIPFMRWSYLKRKTLITVIKAWELYRQPSVNREQYLFHHFTICFATDHPIYNHLLCKIDELSFCRLFCDTLCYNIKRSDKSTLLIASLWFSQDEISDQHDITWSSSYHHNWHLYVNHLFIGA